MKFSYITDHDIQALIDDELDHEKAKNVRAYLDRHPNAQKRYDKLTEQKRLLQNWWNNYKS